MPEQPPSKHAPHPIHAVGAPHPPPPAPAPSGAMRPRRAVRWGELLVQSNHTFLGGASHPEELVAEAARLGHAGIALAGDFVRLPIPSALMERAVASGFLAANTLLAPQGIKPEPVYSVPLRGLLGRRAQL